MNRRLDLHEKFVGILGSRYVYFQPPESLKINYPCIVYELAGLDVNHADNINYKTMYRYNVTLIDKNPDSDFVSKLADMPWCEMGRPFVSNNLNHFPFTLYY